MNDPAIEPAAAFSLSLSETDRADFSPPSGLPIQSRPSRFANTDEYCGNTWPATVPSGSAARENGVYRPNGRTPFFVGMPPFSHDGASDRPTRSCHGARARWFAASSAVIDGWSTGRTTVRNLAAFAA